MWMDYLTNNIDNIRIEREKIKKFLSQELLSNYIVIYGCGNIGTTFYNRLKNFFRGDVNVIAFIDELGSIHGEMYDGVPICKIDEFKNLYKEHYLRKDILVIITHLNNNAFFQQKTILINKLKDYICNIHFFTEFKMFEMLFPAKGEYSAYCGENIDELYLNINSLKKTYDVLEDKLSKKTFDEIMGLYVSVSPKSIDIRPEKEWYFDYSIYTRIDNEVFVDCGAYQGDTLEKFFKYSENKFDSYIAIEADKVNYEKLENLVNSMKDPRIKCIKAFLSEKKKTIKFSNSGTSYSHVTDNDSCMMVEALPLDDILIDYKPTMIKFNVEGAEIEAITGCKTIIETLHPVIAVQGHHRMDHLWKIVDTLRFLDRESQYKYYLRNYGGLSEFTYYAIPNDRNFYVVGGRA